MKERNQGHEKNVLRSISLIPRARKIKKFFQHAAKEKNVKIVTRKSFSTGTAQRCILTLEMKHTSSCAMWMFHLSRCRLVATEDAPSASEPRRRQTLIESLEKEMK